MSGLFVTLIGTMVGTACGGDGHGNGPTTSMPAPAATSAAIGNTPASAAPHVLVVMEENRGYAATLGNCDADPYFCSLAARYATFTNAHGVSHPSMPNYYAIISGATQGCTSDGCSPFGAPSLGSQLDATGLPWIAYMESMPSACSRNSIGGYAVKHNPFVQSTAISHCATHVLPYPGPRGLLAALETAYAPDFVWITPNLSDDMHDGSVAQGDAWLAANVKPVLASAWFLDYRSTVIITMDEGDAGSSNQIPTVVVSRSASGAGAVSTSINHYAVLRAIESVFGLTYLGNAASAPVISQFFG